MTYPISLRPLGYQQIVGVAAATGLTVPEGAFSAIKFFEQAASATLDILYYGA